MRRLLLLLWLVSAAWGESRAYRPEAFSEELLQKAESGDAEAQCKLAGAYREGRGVEKNPAEYLKWLQHSADAGFGLAQLILAKELLEGESLLKDPSKAEQLIFSAERNLATSPGPYTAKVEYYLGLSYLMFEERRNLEKALRFLRSAVEKNDSCAQHTLGKMCAEGWGMEKNEELALAYLQKSAADEPACGKASLGEFYLKRGRYEEARDWLERAAEKGETSSQTYLGLMYRKGQGMKPNLDTSSDWFQKAAEQGDLKAKYEMAKNRKLRGDEKGAFSLFMSIAEEPLAPGNHEKNYQVGVACLEVGHVEKARQAMQQGSLMNAYGARSLRPEGMRRTAPDDVTLVFSVEILDENRENIGSGVLVGAEGKVLTAAHVVAEKTVLFIRDSAMRTSPVMGLWDGLPNEDLALLQTGARDFTGAVFSPRPPELGDKIKTTGHPAQTISALSSEGAIRRVIEGGGRSIADLGVFPGFSGSGVFNERNELVGVVITSHGDPSARDSLKGPPGIQTTFEALPRLEAIMKKSKDEASMLPLAKVPDLKHLGLHWNRKKNEDRRTLEVAKSMLDGSPEQVASSFAMLVRLGETGNAEAQNMLGLCYSEGRGTPIDYTKAAEHFLLAAQQGESCAKHHLGMLYLDGAGVPRDDAKALEWLEKAAQDAPACGKLFLGIYYHRKNDLVNALRWYRVAQEQGDGRAESYLAQIRSHRPEAPKQEIPASP